MVRFLMLLPKKQFDTVRFGWFSRFFKYPLTPLKLTICHLHGSNRFITINYQKLIQTVIILHKVTPHSVENVKLSNYVCQYLLFWDTKIRVRQKLMKKV